MLSWKNQKILKQKDPIHDTFACRELDPFVCPLAGCYYFLPQVKLFTSMTLLPSPRGLLRYTEPRRTYRHERFLVPLRGVTKCRGGLKRFFYEKFTVPLRGITWEFSLMSWFDRFIYRPLAGCHVIRKQDVPYRYKHFLVPLTGCYIFDVKKEPFPIVLSTVPLRGVATK